MDIIQKLQAYRQELCEIDNENKISREASGKIHLAITRIDMLIEALTELEQIL